MDYSACTDRYFLARVCRRRGIPSYRPRRRQPGHPSHTPLEHDVLVDRLIEKDQADTTQVDQLSLPLDILVHHIAPLVPNEVFRRLLLSCRLLYKTLYAEHRRRYAYFFWGASVYGPYTDDVYAELLPKTPMPFLYRPDG